jgi:hypothetical protein
MGPGKLGTDFKTIKITCQNGHEVARYRKPRAEWGHRTHKLWLVAERINRLVTEPPIIVPDEQSEMTLDIPELGTKIQCGEQDCVLQVGTIALVKGTVALELDKSNLKPAKG